MNLLWYFLFYFSLVILFTFIFIVMLLSTSSLSICTIYYNLFNYFYYFDVQIIPSIADSGHIVKSLYCTFRLSILSKVALFCVYLQHPTTIFWNLCNLHTIKFFISSLALSILNPYFDYSFSIFIFSHLLPNFSLLY